MIKANRVIYETQRIFSFNSLLLVAVTGQATIKFRPIIVEDDYVPVYVLAGQSNMEGSTYFDNGQVGYVYERDGLDPLACFVVFPMCDKSCGFYPYGGVIGKLNTICFNKPIQWPVNFSHKGRNGADNKSMGPELGQHTLQNMPKKTVHSSY